MELTASQAGELTGTDVQLVRRAIRDGSLWALRSIGQTIIIDDIAATAWKRATARGRRWTEEVRQAALDLASTGKTQRLSHSERSRLRGKLRAMDAQAFAHAAGGLGGAWGRYSAKGRTDGTAIGPDAVDLSTLGIVSGDTGIRYLRVDDLDDFETYNDVTLDAWGSICIVERADDNRAARILLDTYLLGSSRESAAAAAELERACHAI